MPGPGARSDHHRRLVEVGVGKFVDAPRERGYHAADHHGRHLRRCEVALSEQVDEHQPELVAGEAVIGVDPEVGDELVAVEHPDDDVGVPDVDREQHRGECRHHRPVIALLDIGGTKIAASAGRGAAIGAVRRIPTPVGLPARDAARPDRGGDGRRAPGGDRDLGARALRPRDRARSATRPGCPPRGTASRWPYLLGQRFDCPVVVENDANCAALAEARLGAGAGHRTVVYWTVSTGIGCGVVRDGRIVVGRHDTEGGHMVLWPAWLGGPPCHCGGAGCLEALASGRAITRRYGVAPEHLSDPDAWVEIGRWIGLATVNVTAVHDPDVVIFGGGVCASWARFAPSLLRDRRSATCVSSRDRRSPAARLGEDRSLLGALLIAEDNGEDPARLLTAR